MRGAFLVLLVGLAFVVGTATLVWQFNSGLNLEEDYRFLGPLLFALLGAGVLIAFFLIIRRKR
ncbi:MAG TPA: hypothetical protein VKY54_08490 [Kiloniellales bacterium]|jgi:cytochrome bd-type quinol oxidase subunit 1|nr:hypothetical protein [Kiloniellales bacterium]